MIKSRGMRWTANVAFLRERRGKKRVFIGKPEGTSWKT
jgi:hypothetical protein